MKSINDIIADIQKNYGVYSGTPKEGVCELCGYDTSSVNNCSIAALPYKGRSISACGYCCAAARKKYIGVAGVSGRRIDKLDSFFIPTHKVLECMSDEKMAELLVSRLQKRLTGFKTQKQMVPS